MRKTGLLTDRDIRNAKPEPGKKVARLLDGDRLYLFASVALAAFELYEQGGIKWDAIEDINKTFVFRYQLDGVTHDYGIGPYPTVSLAEARRRAGALRLMILDGIDPMQERKDRQAERKAKLAAERKVMTFAQCAEQYIRIHAPTWKAPKHRKIWESTLRTYVLPVIGKLDVAHIESGHVAKVLTPIWATKTVTAKRVANRIELVINYAIAHGFRKAEAGNPASRKLINSMLGKIKGSNGHHDALPYIDAPAFVAELRKRDLVSARALEFAILTAARTDEALGAVWSEFDLAKKLWTIPAERMKAGKEHRVPLSGRVIEILKSVPRHGDHVFMNGKTRFHKNTLHKLLKKMGPAATVHGFRSSFRDWAEERTHYPEPVREMALAHETGPASLKAYRRTDLFDKRVHLMQDWATFLSRPVTPADVVDLGAEKAARRV
jgi:integrase